MSTGSLNYLLRHLDGTAPSIQKAASAMMKHYDQTAVMAVTEWRNVLSTTRVSTHLISMLYVANEVLQISKRNRGPKFLEAFSAVLGQALQHICRQDPSLTDKVRRTVKIWGDRHVFSLRFVQELLSGLETFRNAPPPPRRTPTATTTTTTPSHHQHHAPREPSNLPSSRPTFHEENDDDGARFSPVAAATPSDSNASPASEKKGVDQETEDEEENIMDILESQEKDKEEEEDDDDDDEDIFATNDDSAQLKVDLDLDQVSGDTASKKNASSKPGAMSKRRRSSAASVESGGKRRRRNSSMTGKTAMSANSLLDLSNKVTALQDDFDESQRTLERIDKNLSKTTKEDLEQIVGDELQVEYRQIIRHQEQMTAERRRLHGIASERKGLEQEALAYLPWLEKALDQDQRDIEFCNRLEKDLEAFLPVHAQLKKARDKRRSEEQQRLQQEAERERARKEAEEAERFRQETMRRQTEQSDGMVWNPATREYVTLDTNESWREN